MILVHPCDLGSNGGCDQVCKKSGSHAVCACNVGFELSADKVSCVKGTQEFLIQILIE